MTTILLVLGLGEREPVPPCNPPKFDPMDLPLAKEPISRKDVKKACEALSAAAGIYVDHQLLIDLLNRISSAGISAKDAAGISRKLAEAVADPITPQKVDGEYEDEKYDGLP